MLSIHSLLIYHKDGVNVLSAKEFRRKLFCIITGFLVCVSAALAFNVYRKQSALNKEIIALSEEYDRLDRKISHLKEKYNLISQVVIEQHNIRRVITAINPWLENEEIELWVKMVRHNAADVIQSLNSYSLYKLESPLHEYSFDPGASLLLAVAALESDYNLYTRSRKGAYGPMQLRKGAAQYVGVLNMRDPVENINGGTKYLCDLFYKYYDYPDQMELSLASYNAGRTRVQKEWIPNWGEKWNNIHNGLISKGGAFKETRNYVSSIRTLTHLFVSGEWNNQNRRFWSNYKFLLGTNSLATLDD